VLVCEDGVDRVAGGVDADAHVQQRDLDAAHELLQLEEFVGVHELILREGHLDVGQIDLLSVTYVQAAQRLLQRHQLLEVQSQVLERSVLLQVLLDR